MQIVGDRRFVEIPGNERHELPPLLVYHSLHLSHLDEVINNAKGIVESEGMIAPGVTGLTDEVIFRQREFELAINLVEQYKKLVLHWRWGQDILEWIRQCEITFEGSAALRHLLRSDLWPHAGRSSFVTLLRDKNVQAGDISLDKAVGLRLSFRQPPPISCFSSQFLFHLNATVATSAYQTWARLNPDPISSLPPERFFFKVVDMGA